MIQKCLIQREMAKKIRRQIAVFGVLPNIKKLESNPIKMRNVINLLHHF